MHVFEKKKDTKKLLLPHAKTTILHDTVLRWCCHVLIYSASLKSYGPGAYNHKSSTPQFHTRTRQYYHCITTAYNFKRLALGWYSCGFHYFFTACLFRVLCFRPLILIHLLVFLDDTVKFRFTCPMVLTAESDTHTDNCNTLLAPADSRSVPENANRDEFLPCFDDDDP